MSLHLHRISVWALSIYLLSNIQVYGQNNLQNYDFKWMHWGITLATNSTNFKIIHDPNFLSNDTLYVLESEPKTGINLGIVTDLRLGEYFNLRFIPSLSFARRNLVYTFKDNIVNKKKVESTFVDFPLTMKYKSHRYGNFRAYVIAGGKYSIDLASQKYIDPKNRIEELMVKLEPNNFYYEYGIGFDFYFPMFKYSLEIKQSIGINDVLYHEKHVFASSIQKLLSRVFLFSMHFE